MKICCGSKKKKNKKKKWGNGKIKRITMLSAGLQLTSNSHGFK